jgi:predicted kinase
MPRLVLINGAPSSGKSTLAKRYVEEHPLTLALDIDVVRAMLGCWLDHPVEAGLMARRMALEMTRVQLLAGHDVVIPQFLGRLGFVLALEQLCNDVRAEFIEVVLLAEPQDLAQRFARRSARPLTAEHRDAAALLERSGGLQALPEMYDRLIQIVASRPQTRAVVTIDGQIEQAYSDLLAQLDAGAPPRPSPPVDGQ